MEKLILATHNQGKIKELTALLSPISCVPQALLHIEEIEETGQTFVENALLKARHASLLGKLPALADDSGLVVKALQGEPGIYSARFAAQHQSPLSNVDYVLERMRNVQEREAYFYGVVVLVMHPQDPAPLIAIGRWEGQIAESASGSGGFGYDPIFYLPEYQCTAAALESGVKNQVSHRAQALKMLLSSLLIHCLDI